MTYSQEVIQTEWYMIRVQRNYLLSLCDWTQLSDVNLSIEEKQAWSTYRQALRDVTDQSDPFNITWPQKPNFNFNI
jgi:hypothetical protein